MTSLLRPLIWSVLCVLSAGLMPRIAAAQTPTATPTGEFQCSAGPRDGRPCNSDDDCLGGACVIAQGVCSGGSDDSFPCDCGGGQCTGSSVSNTCSESGSGICSGGANNTESCGCNCAGGAACIGTQKVCLSGDSQGFSCLNNAQCGTGQCASTGKFCDGGDFDGFSCVVDANCCVSATCAAGTCHAPVGVTPSPAVPTRTGTATGTTAPGQPTPTPPPAGTPPTAPAGVSSTVAQDANSGSLTIVLVDGSGFPISGRVQIGDDPTPLAFIRNQRSNILTLSTPLTHNVPAGTRVTNLAPASGGGPVIFATSAGGGCTLSAATPPSGGLFGLALGAMAAAGLRRRARR